MKNRGSASTRSVRLRFRNERERAIEFHLEPWGEIHLVPIGSTLEMSVNGASEEVLELIYSDSSVTLWATTGSTVSLFLDGRDLHEGMKLMQSVPAGVGAIKKLFG